MFYEIMHKEIEFYMNDMIIKTRKLSDHVKNTRKFFERLQGNIINLKSTKFVFGVPFGKLLGFIVSQYDINLYPSKLKAIRYYLYQRIK